MASETDLAWLAGFLDGEGCITLHNSPRHRFSIQLHVSNLDLASLERCRAIAGAGAVLQKKGRMRPNERRGWLYEIYGHKAKALIRQVVPYMTARRPQAEILAQFPIARQGHRVGPLTKVGQAVAYARIKELNRRGT